MRHIRMSEIEKTVERLCIQANIILRPDIRKEIEDLYNNEKDLTLSKKSLGIILENADIAEKEKIAICQDTGLVTVFVELGADVVIKEGLINDAINNGVKTAYNDCFFRKSVVSDPILRNNTGTNTPSDIHVDIVKGDKISVAVMPKGFGSENKGVIKMMNPTSKAETIVDFCVDVVKKSGSDACPPYVLGVGIGGTMSSCAYLAKKALLRPVSSTNPKDHIARIEKDIKRKANELKIGVMGLGGASTVMGVNVETAPTHIAGLPVAVNVACHALRSARAVI